jgi:hypothetical protein
LFSNNKKVHWYIIKVEIKLLLLIAPIPDDLRLDIIRKLYLESFSHQYLQEIKQDFYDCEMTDASDIYKFPQTKKLI